MDLNEYASLFLDAFHDGEEAEGGMAHFAALKKLALTGTADSLERLDAFLLRLNKDGYGIELDLDAVPVQNFLYLLAFYLGGVAGDLSEAETTWITYEVLIDANPNLEEQIPCVLGTSVICMVGSSLYFPLSDVMARLIEGDDAPSVPASVQAIVAKDKP